MKRIAALFALAAGALALSGCGFQPIYATQGDATPVNSQIHLERLVAPENVASTIEDAINARVVNNDNTAPRYELYVQATERATRLAVQIDATVTRYNYTLQARYWVRDKQTGEVVRGVARVITSYNIVNSQYSTLFAERTAIEKAARQLAEKIERDILIRFSRAEGERDNIDDETFENILDKEEATIIERRRDKDVDTSIPADLYFLMPGQDPGVNEDNADSNNPQPETTDDAASHDVPDPVVE